MKTISVVNLKGGVGKTTTVIELADILATEHGKRVVVADADPQANLTSFLCPGADLGATMADVLSGACDYIYDAIYDTSISGVQILPGTMDLIMADIASVTDGDKSPLKRLHDFRDCLAEDDTADYFVIDCPPGFTAASVAAIAASDEIIIPVKIDAFAMDGVRELQRQIDGLKTINPDLGYGILITFWHNVEVVRAGVENFLRVYGDHVFHQYIRRSDKVDEATFMRQPLSLWSPTSSAGRDYRAWVDELLMGGGKNG